MSLIRCFSIRTCFRENEMEKKNIYKNVCARCVWVLYTKHMVMSRSEHILCIRQRENKRLNPIVIRKISLGTLMGSNRDEMKMCFSTLIFSIR